MQALGSLLQLPPCPFWRLEAAIAPGPRLPPEEPPPSKEETLASETSPFVEDNAEGQSQASSHPFSSTPPEQLTVPTQPELVHQNQHRQLPVCSTEIYLCTLGLQRPGPLIQRFLDILTIQHVRAAE